ncbi:hypothetical protein Taro_028580, partial [Colocasia esculenta]|nr:hypothetical protein [Colocasia esculenta]
MLALVPLGTELERIMGSVRLVFLMFLLATSNGLLHMLLAFVIANNPVQSFPYLVNECAIGFSGILFSMTVIETSLSGAQTRRLVLSTMSTAYWFDDYLSFFSMELEWDYFDFPRVGVEPLRLSKSRSWTSFVQQSISYFDFPGVGLLASNVSLVGHLCGILSGFAYTYGLFNFLLPGPSFYSAVESFSI